MSSKNSNSKKKSVKKVSQIKKSGNFFSHKKNLFLLVPFFLILFSMFIAYDVRDGPVNFSEIDKVIKDGIHVNIKNEISSRVNSQNPSLNELQRNNLIDQEFNSILDSGFIRIGANRVSIQELVADQLIITSDEFKSEDGQTYLIGLDSHYFYKEAENFYFNGHTGDSLREDKSGNLVPFTKNRESPKGVNATYNPEFLSWVGAQMFSLNNINLDSTTQDKISSIFLVVVFISILVVIPFYLLVRKFVGDVPAFIGSLFLVTQSTFVGRTVAGIFDTEPFGLLFPMIISAIIILGFIYKSYWTIILTGLFAGFFQGMALWSWKQNWFIFVIIIISILTYLIFILLSNLKNQTKFKQYKQEIYNTLLLFISYLIFSIIFVYFLAKYNLIYVMYDRILSYLSRIFASTSEGIWPNTLSLVSELRRPSLSELFTILGGNMEIIGQVLFFTALSGLFLFLLGSNKGTSLKYRKQLIIGSFIWFSLFIFAKLFSSLVTTFLPLYITLLFLPLGLAFVFSILNNNNQNNILFAVLVTVWFGVTLFMSFLGVRFILLLSGPFILSVALGFYYISEFIRAKIDKLNLDSNKSIPLNILLVLIIGLLLFLPVYNNAQEINRLSLPEFGNTWHNAMDYIELNSDENAIINTWWDAGHFVRANSDRGVTFDGASQETPQPYYWVGRLLIEQDENVSKDILKMLTCGWDNALERVNEVKNSRTSADKIKSIYLLDKTFGVKNKTEIFENYSDYTFTDSEIEYIIEVLSCESPRQTFLITSNEMIESSPIWSYWGGWDFTKKYVYDNKEILSAKEISENLNEDLSLIETYLTQIKQIENNARITSKDESNLINSWFSSYLMYTGSISCLRNQEMLNCDRGIEINLSSGDYLRGQLSNDVSFNNLIYNSQLSGEIEVLNLGDGNYDLVLLPSGQRVELIFTQSPLGTSLFTKLFYLNGKGLNYFSKFYEGSSQVGGGKVIVWEVNWNRLE